MDKIYSNGSLKINTILAVARGRCDPSSFAFVPFKHGKMEVREPDSSSSIFLSQDCFGSLGSFVSPCKFNIFCSSSVKNAIGNLIQIALNP